jgi:hypothetical protein
MRNKKVIFWTTLLYSIVFYPFLTGFSSLAADEATVTATVTVQNVSVSVDPGSVSYGTLALNTSRSTLSGEANAMQTATNDGNVSANINIRGTNSTAWTLSASNGANNYVHQFCNETDVDCSTPPTDYTALTTSNQTLKNGVSTSGEVDFHLRITTPTSSSSYDQQNVNVTIQASAAS